MNYFTIFQIKESCIIDTDELQNIYIVLQEKYHPDSADCPDIEKSIEINEGYKTLLDPFLRTKHFLQINNVTIPEGADVNHSFLIRMFALQESISTMTIEQRKLTEQSIKSEIDENLTYITSNIKHCDEKSSSNIVESYLKIKYLLTAIKTATLSN